MTSKRYFAALLVAKSQAVAAVARHERSLGVVGWRVPVGGDLVTAIDGKPVKDRNAITRAISSKHAGDLLMLTIYRDGHNVDLKVTLAAEAPAERF